MHLLSVSFCFLFNFIQLTFQLSCSTKPCSVFPFLYCNENQECGNCESLNDCPPEAPICLKNNCTSCTLSAECSSYYGYNRQYCYFGSCVQCVTNLECAQCNSSCRSTDCYYYCINNECKNCGCSQQCITPQQNFEPISQSKEVFVTPVKSCFNQSACDGSVTQPFDNIINALDNFTGLFNLTITLLNANLEPHYMLLQEVNPLTNASEFRAQNQTFNFEYLIIKPLFCNDARLSTTLLQLANNCTNNEESLTIIIKNSNFSIVVNSLNIENVILNGKEDILALNGFSSQAEMQTEIRKEVCPTGTSVLICKGTYTLKNTKPALFVVSFFDQSQLILRNGGVSNFHSAFLNSFLEISNSEFKLNVLNFKIENCYFSQGIITSANYSLQSEIIIQNLSFYTYNNWLAFYQPDQGASEGYFLNIRENYLGSIKILNSQFSDSWPSTVDTCPNISHLNNSYFNESPQNFYSRTDVLTLLQDLTDGGLPVSSLILISVLAGELLIQNSTFTNIIGTQGSVLNIQNLVPGYNLEISDSEFESNFAYYSSSNIQIQTPNYYKWYSYLGQDYVDNKGCPFITIANSSFSNAYGCFGSYGNILLICSTLYFDQTYFFGYVPFSLQSEYYDNQTYISILNNSFQSNKIAVSNSLAIIGIIQAEITNNNFEDNLGTSGPLGNAAIRGSYFDSIKPNASKINNFLDFYGQSTALYLRSVLKVSLIQNIFRNNYSPNEFSPSLGTDLTMLMLFNGEKNSFIGNTFRDHQGFLTAYEDVLINSSYWNQTSLPLITILFLTGLPINGESQSLNFVNFSILGNEWNYNGLDNSFSAAQFYPQGSYPSMTVFFLKILNGLTLMDDVFDLTAVNHPQTNFTLNFENMNFINNSLNSANQEIGCLIDTNGYSVLNFSNSELSFNDFGKVRQNIEITSTDSIIPTPIFPIQNGLICGQEGYALQGRNIHLVNMTFKSNYGIIISLSQSKYEIDIRNSQFQNNKCKGSSMILAHQASINSFQNNFESNYNNYGIFVLQFESSILSQLNYFSNNDGYFAKIMFAMNNEQQPLIFTQINLNISSNLEPDDHYLRLGIPVGSNFYIEQSDFQLTSSKFVGFPNILSPTLVSGLIGTITFENIELLNYFPYNNATFGIFSYSSVEITSSFVHNQIFNQSLYTPMIVGITSSILLTNLSVININANCFTLFDSDIIVSNSQFEMISNLFKMSSGSIKIENIIVTQTIQILQASSASITIINSEFQNFTQLSTQNPQYIQGYSLNLLVNNSNFQNGVGTFLSLTQSTANLISTNFTNFPSIAYGIDLNLKIFDVRVQNNEESQILTNMENVLYLLSSTLIIDESIFMGNQTSCANTLIFLTNNCQLTKISNSNFQVTSKIVSTDALISNITQNSFFSTCNSFLQIFSKQLWLTSNKFQGVLPNSSDTYNLEIQSVQLEQFEEAMVQQNTFMNTTGFSASGINLTFQSNEVQNNYNIEQNGVCSFLNVHAILITNCKFENNIGYQGGAMYIGNGIHNGSVLISNCEFIRNSAIDYGGAVYFTNIEPPIFLNNNFESNYACDNKINHVGTIPIKISPYSATDPINHKQNYPQNTSTMIESTPSFMTFGAQPAILNTETIYSFMTLDIFGQLRFCEQNLINLVPQSPVQPGWSNIFSLTPQKGIYALQNFKFEFLPGKQLIIDLCLPNKSYCLNAACDPICFQTEVSFQNCTINQVFVPPYSCNPCPIGFWYLNAEPNGLGPCTQCDPNAECNGGNNITIDPGFWRMNELADQVVPCPNPENCEPSQYPPGVQCKYPSTGNLCTECVEGYTPYGPQFKCIQCVNSKIAEIELALGLSIQAFIIIYTLYAIIHAQTKGVKKENNNGNLPVLVKILTNYCATVAIAQQYKVSWPSVSSSILSYAGKISQIGTEFTSFNCLFKGITSIPSVYLNQAVINLMPIAYTIIAYFMWLAIFRSKKLEVHGEIFQRRIITTIVIIFFNLQPQIMQTNLNKYQCVNLYRQDQPELYLDAEPSIRCWTTQHIIWGLGFFAAWLIICGVFLPLWMFKNLKKNYSVLNSEEISQRYGFIYEGYNREHYYWEFVTMIRKYSLILALVFGGMVSSSVEIYFGVIIVLISLILQIINEPFETSIENRVELIGIITALLVNFCALFYRMVPNQSALSPIFVGLSLIGNSGFWVYWIYIYIRLQGESGHFRCKNLCKKIKKSKNMNLFSKGYSKEKGKRSIKRKNRISLSLTPGNMNEEPIVEKQGSADLITRQNTSEAIDSSDQDFMMKQKINQLSFISGLDQPDNQESSETVTPENNSRNSLSPVSGSLNMNLAKKKPSPDPDVKMKVTNYYMTKQIFDFSNKTKK